MGRLSPAGTGVSTVMSSVVKVTKVRRTAGHVVAILWIQWLRYYVETEEYDRKLPGKWFRPDEWMPAYEHLAESRRFASKMLEDVRRKIAEDAPEAEADEVDAIRRRAGEMGHEEATTTLTWWLTEGVS